MRLKLIDRDRSVTAYPFNISLTDDFTHQAATLELAYSTLISWYELIISSFPRQNSLTTISIFLSNRYKFKLFF